MSAERCATRFDSGKNMSYDWCVSFANRASKKTRKGRVNIATPVNPETTVMPMMNPMNTAAFQLLVSSSLKHKNHFTRSFREL